jgi:hypothetical protein
MDKPKKDEVAAVKYYLKASKQPSSNGSRCINNITRYEIENEKIYVMYEHFVSINCLSLLVFFLRGCGNS